MCDKISSFNDTFVPNFLENVVTFSCREYEPNCGKCQLAMLQSFKNSRILTQMWRLPTFNLFFLIYRYISARIFKIR